MNEIRINKLLSEMGVCSRREADRLLIEGRVSVNGKPAGPGLKVSERAEVEIDGKSVMNRPKPVVLAFNKPRGIVCTESDNDRAPNIIDFIGYKDRIFTIGRLDKDSEGLILLTNRGELVNLVNRASLSHEKEYVVRCTHRLTDGFLKKMAGGVEIKLPQRESAERSDRSEKSRFKKNENTQKKSFKLVKTRPCRVRRIDDHTFDIVLTQGLNRQIRRMTSALGNDVERLRRIRVMNIELGDLKEGQYREVSGRELKELEVLAGIRH